MKPDFSEFEKKIGVNFKDKDLLKQAFIHRSYINENPNVGLHHNERLEFLGDAVLELITTEFLYNKFPDKPEGELTAYRASLVNTISISKASSEMGANDFLLLSKGEDKDQGRARQYILANTFESVIGAIYLDRGYDIAKEFISKRLFPYLDEVIAKRLWQDAKSFFQEQAQEHTGITPMYKTLDESGPDHDKKFKIGVFLEDELIAEGEGRSKQDAEQESAKEALKVKDWEN